VKQKKRKRRTNRLLLAILDTLDVQDDPAVLLLLSRHDLGVELELESLLGKDLLEGLAVKGFEQR
jgi:hypothetical protein